MRIKLLDTLTGETTESCDYDAFYWADGNGSCDRNRESYFGVESPSTGFCLGGKRFLIIEADTTDYTLAELNSDYPDDVLKIHGIGDVKPPA